MTVAEAVRRLCAAGRIERPWLPGMLVQCCGIRYRVAGEVDGELLSIRPDLMGSCVWRVPRPWLIDPSDLNDPATVGCLLALLREAWSEQATSVILLWSPVSQAWVCRDAARNVWSGSTEGEAIAAALVGLATSVAP